MKLSLPPPLLGSICLEPNRWKPEALRVPSFRVSSLSDRLLAAGFSGWELFEDHYFKADAGERAALSASAAPIVIFNTYAIPGIDPDQRWEGVVEAVRALGPQVRGVKFNLGKGEPDPRQVGAALRWANALPEGVVMLCECHPGTWLETPHAAAEAFSAWPEERFSAIVHPVHAEVAPASEWFEFLGGRIAHLHWQARSAGGGFCQLGERPELLTSAAILLGAHQFMGTHTVEFTAGTGKPGETPEGQFEKALSDLASLQSVISIG